MKKILAAAAIAAIVPLSGCAGVEAPPGDNDAIPVCVDAKTKERLPEDRCGGDYRDSNPSDSSVMWWFLMGQMTAPNYGYPVYVGYSTPPANVRVIHSYRAPTSGTVKSGAVAYKTYQAPKPAAPKYEAPKTNSQAAKPAAPAQTYKPYPNAPKAPAPAPAKPAAPAAPAGKR